MYALNLLLKITELVDKDIAENSRPISWIGISVPWLPFVFFVDGAPADSHPVLSGLALGISLGWALFVMWRLVRYTKEGLQPSYEQLGPARFWALMAGTLAAILLIAAVLMWLED